jgi:two-component system response regulator HydG
MNVIRVDVPPLRERTGDIPLLANFFLRRYAAKNDKVLEAVTARAMDAMGRHAWPGNVRELENVIERAVVLSRDAVIDLDDLPPAIAESSGAASIADANLASPAADGRGIYLSVGTSLDEAERRLLTETLKATGGDKNLAAKILGVATRTIYRKLNQDKQTEQDEPLPEGDG